MMFKCNNVTITLKDTKVIVNNLNFILNKGDKLALIGEEGNGKSTLMNFFVCKDLIDDYCNYSGTVYYDGISGHLKQNLNEYNDCYIKDYLNENNEYKEYIIKKLFNEFKLDSDIFSDSRKIATLSGGEKVKLQLVKLNLEKRDILFLDEPSNDLDLGTLELLENYITSFEGIVLFVSHDNYLLSRVSNKILHFEKNKDNGESLCTFFNGNYDVYLEQRKIKIEKQNNMAYLQTKEIERKEAILRKFKQKVENDMAKAVRDPTTGRLLAKKMKNILSQEKKLSIKEENKCKKTSDDKTINASFSSGIKPIPSSKVILDLKDENLFIKDKLLVSNLNFLVKGNEHVCIIGDNGVGKSTFLKYAKNQIKETEMIKVGYFPQDYKEILDFELTPIEYLQLNLPKDNATRGKIMTYLSAFNFMEDELFYKIKNLSSGEQAKVIFIKLILEECNVLLLDEPTRNMSSLALPSLIKILKEFGGCIIAISHDRYFIENVGEKIYLLDKNGIKIVN